MSDRQARERGDALARDAAHWFARMRGFDAEASREAFEAWLAEGPAHRRAYNRAAEIFAMGKLLTETERAAGARWRHAGWRASLAAVAACIFGIGGWVAIHQQAQDKDPRKIVAITTDRRTVSTRTGETAVVRLADGSRVRLGKDSMVEVDIGSNQRDLRLLRGQARFEVAHEGRPFIVFAGGGSVIARGTIFDVALTLAGKVDVRLLQGAVDVVLPSKHPASQHPLRKLAAGESVSFVVRAKHGVPPPGPNGPTPSGSPIAARNFEAAPVSELLALANRLSDRPIRLADAALGSERISGRFRVDDTELLARRLGALLGRSVDVRDSGQIIVSAGNEAPPAPSQSKAQALRSSGQ